MTQRPPIIIRKIIIRNSVPVLFGCSSGAMSARRRRLGGRQRTVWIWNLGDWSRIADGRGSVLSHCLTSRIGRAGRRLDGGVDAADVAAEHPQQDDQRHQHHEP